MIREKINTERLRQGLSVRKLAIACDMQVTQLSRYLKGEKGTNDKSIEKLLEVLGLEVINKNLKTIK